MSSQKKQPIGPGSHQMNWGHLLSSCTKICLCVCLLCLNSCDSVTKYSNDFLTWVGFNSETKKPETTRPEKKTTTKDNKIVKQSPETQMNDTDIIVTKTSDDNSEKIQKKDLKVVVAPEFKVEAPVDVQKRIGGVARFIDADDNYIYLDFPQHFSIYNHQLNLLVSHKISYPVVEVKRVEKNNKTYLYLKEETNVLEILELKSDPNSHSLSEINSFVVDGNFYWIHPELLVIFLKEKIQFLDFTDPNNIKIINETPVAGVESAFIVKKNLFLSRNGFLDILDLDKFNVTSSVRIGKKFDFLGVVEMEGKKKLLLSCLSKENHLQGIQYLQLEDDLSKINDFGEKVVIKDELQDVSVDLTNQIIIGREVEEPKEIQIYSIPYRRNLRGSLNTESHFLEWKVFGSDLYIVSPKEISIFGIDLNLGVISQSESIQDFLNQPSQNTPLAQIGAQKKIRDEYALSVKQKLDLMSDSRKVALLNANHLIIVENTKDETNQKIFVSKNLSQDEFTLSEPTTSVSTRYDKLLVTSFGLLMHSKLTKEIYFLDTDFSQVKTLPIKVNNLFSWQNFQYEDKEFLALTSFDKNNNQKYLVSFYELKSPTEINLAHSLSYTQIPFVLYIPETQIIVITNEKMDLYSWDDINQSKSQPTPEESIDIKALNLDFISIKLSPAKDTLYALTKKKERYVIFVMSLIDIKEHTTLEDFDITPSQFQGSSFSKRGRLFILPSSEGTLFYDMTRLDEVHEVAHWPVPSEYVDLADKGEFICVALGYQGVYCGKLLF